LNSLLWKTEKQVERIERYIREIREEIGTKIGTSPAFLYHALNEIVGIKRELQSVRDILQPLDEEFKEVLRNWNIHKKGGNK
jgi:hypothetical protein